MKNFLTSLFNRIQNRPATNAHPFRRCGDFFYSLQKDGSAVVQGYRGKKTSVAIPAVLDGHPVSQVGSTETLFTLNKTTMPGFLNLTRVTVPEGVLCIGSCAFMGSKLTSVTLPESLISIENHAFAHCRELTCITVPGNVRCIGESAFLECSSLKEAHLPKSLPGILSFSFSGCTSLTSIRLPEEAAFIGLCAFEGCTALREVTFPKNLSWIGEYAFASCTALSRVEIPEHVNIICEKAFSNCSALRSVSVMPGRPGEPVPDELAVAQLIGADEDRVVRNDYELPFRNAWSVPAVEEILRAGAAPVADETPEASIPPTYPLGSTPDLFSPEETEPEFAAASSGTVALPDDDPLSSAEEAFRSRHPGLLGRIGDRAFADCTALESITIPEAMRSLGSCSFYNCTALQQVTLPEGLTYLNHYAFAHCRSLTGVTLPRGLEQIGPGAFAYCSSLTDVTLPGGCPDVDTGSSRTLPPWEQLMAVPRGDDYYLEEIRELASITLSAFHGIDHCAFIGCTALATLHIPERIAGIGAFAFWGCESLTEIFLPDRVKTVTTGAFFLCRNLTRVSMPESLEPEQGVFCGCDALKELTLRKV